MKWLGRRQSDNFETGGGGKGLAIGGIGTVIAVIIGLIIFIPKIILWAF